MKILHALPLILVASPALADNPIQSADARVTELRGQYAKALQTRDNATIAAARARLKAAEAVAWGARNPAARPAPSGTR